MIPKLICWIFGHKASTFIPEKVVNGMYIGKRYFNIKCPRCNKDLEAEK